MQFARFDTVEKRGRNENNRSAFEENPHHQIDLKTPIISGAVNKSR